jgi:hypothetical protein
MMLKRPSRVIISGMMMIALGVERGDLDNKCKVPDGSSKICMFTCAQKMLISTDVIFVEVQLKSQTSMRIGLSLRRRAAL